MALFPVNNNVLPLIFVSLTFFVSKPSLQFFFNDAKKMSSTDARLLFQHTFLAHKTPWLMEIGFCLPSFQVLPPLLDKNIKK